MNETKFIADMETLLTTTDAGFVNFAGGIDAAIVVGDATGSLSGKSFLAVDLDQSGTFTATDFVIEITGSTVTSLTTATFV
ncbi:MAG: hypothetical protein IPN42_03145 [Methylococcaceae bacterium]|nr:hypothetical protein [Methylococcaceae bacterium]